MWASRKSDKISGCITGALYTHNSIMRLGYWHKASDSCGNRNEPYECRQTKFQVDKHTPNHATIKKTTSNHDANMPNRPQPKYARDHCIYLDFEGEGRSKNQGSPPPHLTGVYRPRSLQWGNAHYKTTFFKEPWKSISHVRGTCEYVPSIAGFISGLIDEVEQNDQKIVYWSDYERAVVEEQWAG